MATWWVSQRFILLKIIILLTIIIQIKAKGTKYVTYSSVIKLMNNHNGARLHSHDIKYGSGSRQQSVTGTETKEDNNSHWIVKGPTNKIDTRGKPIKCGDTIRLEHSVTKKNLHSHRVSSPLSGQQEVSAYGNDDGQGDSGDHWKVICQNDNEYWERQDTVELYHIDTNVYLSTSGRTYGSPINGQVEIVGSYSKDSQAQWKVMEGVFIHPTDFKSSFHDEL
ncbi:hypothetical protein HCN44_002906 [Aphidius gifuensis]|uniref:MIR domain-containing protein n=1 Tax=Aphidius gifuensis TaxID=684658 RepID=A0A834XU88_APHGI|nr:stromal cell-derived factor 2-like protein 1 [Aphidius gifuensis]KAF7991344.1 hypothetical protein HCN44_002906 [Aphidius gifuensis]